MFYFGLGPFWFLRVFSSRTIFICFYMDGKLELVN